MGKYEYIYQCVAQALALEEAEVVGQKVRVANLRYIKNLVSELVSPKVIAEADMRAKDITEQVAVRKSSSLLSHSTK